MAYVRPLKERLRAELNRLCIIYGLDEPRYVELRALKIELRDDIKAILKREGAADNTSIDIYLEEDELVVRIGEFEYRWN
jgi:hypothetical protein